MFAHLINYKLYIYPTFTIFHLKRQVVIYIIFTLNLLEHFSIYLNRYLLPTVYLIVDRMITNWYKLFKVHLQNKGFKIPLFIEKANQHAV